MLGETNPKYLLLSCPRVYELVISSSAVYELTSREAEVQTPPMTLQRLPSLMYPEMKRYQSMSMRKDIRKRKVKGASKQNSMNK